MRIASTEYNHIIGGGDLTMCGATPVSPIYVEGREACEACETCMLIEHVVG